MENASTCSQENEKTTTGELVQLLVLTVTKARIVYSMKQTYVWGFVRDLQLLKNAAKLILKHHHKLYRLDGLGV